MKGIVIGLLSLSLVACGDSAGDGGKLVIDTDNNGNNNGTNNGSNTGSNNGSNNGDSLAGVSILGDAAHDLEAVDFKFVATVVDGLATPRDLEFHPIEKDQLWILNLDDNSTSLLLDTNTDRQAPMKFAGFGKDHFMARPAAIAFNDVGDFASAQETDQITQSQTPADFMGPTLWTSDMSIYDGGHAGHLDMLHNSPNSAGIAWETGNVFWVFDGAHEALTRYDFGSDHGPGGADHSDGAVTRHVEGEVSYVEGVPSHLEYVAASKLLYVADTGNNRVAVLDTTTGERAAALAPNYDGGLQHHWNGSDLKTLATGQDLMLEQPSGLAIHDGVIYVTDNSTSRIVALDMEGNLLDYLDLGDKIQAGGLMGIAFSEDGSLYGVDAAQDRIWCISSK